MPLESTGDYDKFRRKVLRSLPVAFVIVIIINLYVIYTYYHLVPLLNEKKESGIVEIVVFNFLVLVTLICFVLSIFTQPGTIPDTPEWNFNAEKAEERSQGEKSEITEDLDIFQHKVTLSKEFKSNGERRYCKWCAKYKPDRTHHCRVCRKCVLKMDHHCPWISNCVGWGNHKYLLLLILYSGITTSFMAATLAPTLSKTLNQTTIQFGDMVALLLAEILLAFLVVILFSFFIFHMWLVFNSMTTIEFCEKSGRSQTQNNIWFNGYVHSFKQVFGTNPFLWMIPIGNQAGDGINFEYQHNEEEVNVKENEKGEKNKLIHQSSSNSFNNVITDSQTTCDLSSNVIVDCQPKPSPDETSVLLNSK
ncbi:cell cycle regulator with Zn-finger domain [Cryptosporidium ryanae]|uniref:cell cycle regulator with Zn-finger domain n=1 Tax=Cryptosporidium ryanae TaxID=515981 RepID=UPI00351A59D6|nr:cell cycle regulator with Zn-finger domain [Cryptosporidium ryanae]